MFYVLFMSMMYTCLCIFFFNDTATTEIYTLSLHDALPISARTRALPGSASRSPGCAVPPRRHRPCRSAPRRGADDAAGSAPADRKSTRLNSSHANISYAVFCLKKKKKTHTDYKIQLEVQST